MKMKMTASAPSNSAGFSGRWPGTIGSPVPIDGGSVSRGACAGNRARRVRRGGYLLRQVAQFVESLREADGADALSAFLGSWQDRLTTRSRNLLAGAAQLDAYLTLLDQTQRGAADER